MCRNIRTLHNFEPPTTEQEIRDAALQYVRKVSGMQKPSRANEAVFARAVDEVADATARLLEELVTAAPPRSRDVEAERRRARAAGRRAGRRATTGSATTTKRGRRGRASRFRTGSSRCARRLRSSPRARRR